MGPVRSARISSSKNEELGAFVLKTETELLLKSRRVTPGRLLEAGFSFDFPEWPAAAVDLVARFGATR